MALPKKLWAVLGSFRQLKAAYGSFWHKEKKIDQKNLGVGDANGTPGKLDQKKFRCKWRKWHFPKNLTKKKFVT